MRPTVAGSSPALSVKPDIAARQGRIIASLDWPSGPGAPVEARGGRDLEGGSGS